MISRSEGKAVDLFPWNWDLENTEKSKSRRKDSASLHTRIVLP